MSNHDIWKSKRFVASVVAAFVALVIVVLEGYTKTSIDRETVDFVVKGLVYLGGVLVGGYAVEDVVVAAKSGARAAKYDNNTPPQ